MVTSKSVSLVAAKGHCLHIKNKLYCSEVTFHFAHRPLAAFQSPTAMSGQAICGMIQRCLICSEDVLPLSPATPWLSQTYCRPSRRRLQTKGYAIFSRIPCFAPVTKFKYFLWVEILTILQVLCYFSLYVVERGLGLSAIKTCR